MSAPRFSRFNRFNRPSGAGPRDRVAPTPPAPTPGSPPPAIVHPVRTPHRARVLRMNLRPHPRVT
jgi:hypothetical protein